MAFIRKPDDPKGQPYLHFVRLDNDRWEWVAHLPFGCHPERQRAAYELEFFLNRNTRGQRA